MSDDDRSLGKARPMGDEDDRSQLLARSWDEAADGYDRYLVPRFAPWVATAVSALRATPLPPGPILVPCCGTFPELPALARDHPDREIVGIDLSAGMVERARRLTAAHPRARALQHDATALAARWPGTAAAVVSVFGLQQLPDPLAATVDWLAALRPGGRLSVVFWPARTEAEGPFAALDAVVDEAAGGPGGDGEADWHLRVAPAAAAAGALIDRDEDVAHPISHPDAAAFWTAMTDGGPLRRLVLSHGEEFVAALRARFLDRAPSGPWHHRPSARWITAVRPPAAQDAAPRRGAPELLR
jgi:SAM-dependent methyltransferase